MSRLSIYLTRLFIVEAAALTSVVVFLLYLVQCLRMFDLVSAKGQDLLTLAGQAALVMPPVSVVFLYVCIGIGLGRALKALQVTRQLHIIHASLRLRGLFGAIGLYAALSTLVVLGISNFWGPAADQRRFEWTGEIAVDLVSRALIPHRFSELVPGVTVVIGGRQGIGEITGFFADDRRDPRTRQTFFASSALINRSESGYVLELREGKAQYLTADNAYSEISFDRYDLAISTLAETEAEGNGSLTSLQLVEEAMASGVWSEGTIRLLVERNADGLRVIGMCLLIAAIAAFPHGSRRRFGMPLELAALGIAFLERGISSYAPIGYAFAPLTGPVAMLLVGGLLLLHRLRLFEVSTIRRARTA